ncbi:MAG: zinc-ribbon domain-containing protein [bacterium]
MTDFFICPVCGEEVPEDALACPGCGADETTGWSNAAQHYGLDIPDSEFNYGDFAKAEFGASAKPRRIGWLWWVAGILTLLAFLRLLLGGILI